MNAPDLPLNPLVSLLSQRRSSRAIADRPVPADYLDSLLEAARWAPSCYNDQPWQFAVVKRQENEPLWQAVFNTLTEKNRRWAGPAPVLILSFWRKRFTYNDKPNRWAAHDTGAAMLSMALQAQSLGLVCRQIGGYDETALIAALDLEPVFEPGAIMALGYPGEMEQLPQDLQAKEKATPRRRRLSEILLPLPPG